MVGETTIKVEGNKKVLIINYKGASFGADVAQYPQCMKDVIEKLQDVDADEIILTEYYDRIYDAKQTQYLKEIADLVSRLEAENIWAPSHLGKTANNKILSARHDVILTIVTNLKLDFFKAYLQTLQELKQENAKKPSLAEVDLNDLEVYLKTLEFIKSEIENTGVIAEIKKYLIKLETIPTDRSIYRSLFQSAIKPAFIGSRIFFTGIETLTLVDQYEVLGSKVYIYKHPDKVEYLYFINPPEYSLPPEKYFLLEKTKEIVSSHRPSQVAFLDLSQARKYFKRIYLATISDLAVKNNIRITAEEKDDLATIVSRYTIGYGILELILSDRKITDIYIDSPIGEKPIYLVHSKYGQCQTNIVFSEEEARSTVSRFRALSGRPFDEAHPILDYDMPDLQTRVAVIGKPLAIDGIAFALRLHKDTPWTLCQFIDQKMIDPFSAGLFSFFIDAQASMLLVGSRGAGKCLEGDTLIQLADGRLEKIKDIVENKLKRATELTILEDGVCTPCKDVQILTMTKDLQVKRSPIDKVWKRTSPKEMFKILLSSGKEITTTPEHPFFLIENGKLIQKRSDELKIKEKIATPTKEAINRETQSINATSNSTTLQIIREKNSNADILFDEVKDIQKVPPKEPFVYDFTIDETHSFVANGIIAHNTSLLQAFMQEIPQNLRIIVQEDSVTGDSEIIAERNGKMERTTVGKLIDGLIEKGEKLDIDGRELVPVNSENIKVFAMDKQGKIKLAKVSQFTRHKVNKDIYQVKTRSGRAIKVTRDHSLFTVDGFKILKIRPVDLINGGQILVPKISNENSGNFKMPETLEYKIALNGQISIKKTVLGDLLLDEVVSVKKIGHEGTYVYDFSVPECESFVCENIIAHNTSELPVPQLKGFGFNIQRLHTRSPLGGEKQAEASGEVSAEDALRTALRLGDSVLIAGEVRSGDARALYEAMRVGAVGNVVMGTIHGESAYSVWDRVVNDIGVPTTSFKATDFCIVAAPVRLGGSLKRSRRVLEVTEVGKFWVEEPQKENGFNQWMTFDGTTDKLVLHEENAKKSEWLAHVAQRRGVTVDELWSEIQARGETKAFMVEMKNKYNLPLLLEAQNTIPAHNKYLLMGEKQREDQGKVDYTALLSEWKQWVENVLVKEVQAQAIKQARKPSQ